MEQGKVSKILENHQLRSTRATSGGWMQKNLLATTQRGRKEVLQVQHASAFFPPGKRLSSPAFVNPAPQGTQSCMF